MGGEPDSDFDRIYRIFRIGKTGEGGMGSSQESVDRRGRPEDRR
jgi:hypothetical protein